MKFMNKKWRNYKKNIKSKKMILIIKIKIRMKTQLILIKF